MDEINSQPKIETLYLSALESAILLKKLMKQLGNFLSPNPRRNCSYLIKINVVKGEVVPLFMCALGPSWKCRVRNLREN